MNIFDYLSWRGDVPFSADPFNEVDGLVLSELAYTNFAGIVPARGEIGLREAVELFFARTPREVVLETPGSTAPAPLLMEEMSRGPRFRDSRLMHFINVVDKDKSEQMAAVSLLLPDGSVFVSFRGTDNSLVGWREDMALSYGEATPGQKRAAAYLQNITKRFPGPLRVGGHSKGGNFSVYAASCCPPEVQDRIGVVYSFDGPGFRDEVLCSEGYRRILPRVRHLVPEGSIFGMLLTEMAERQVVISSATGFYQHDGFTWQVERNRFVRGELNETARLMDQTMDSWLDHMTDEERSSFFDTVFILLESTGHESLSGVFGQKLKSTESMLGSMVKLPKEKRKELLSFLRELVHIGGKNAMHLHMGRRDED